MPARLSCCCAFSASGRDANGPEITCCQPSETRRRIGRPSAVTDDATDVARASVRNEATTMSKRPVGAVAATAEGTGATVEGTGAAAAGGVGARVAGAVFGTGAIASGGAVSRGVLDEALVAGAGAITGAGLCPAGGRAVRTPSQSATAAAASDAASTTYFVRRGPAGVGSMGALAPKATGWSSW